MSIVCTRRLWFILVSDLKLRTNDGQEINVHIFEALYAVPRLAISFLPFSCPMDDKVFFLPRRLCQSCEGVKMLHSSTITGSVHCLVVIWNWLELRCVVMLRFIACNISVNGVRCT